MKVRPDPVNDDDRRRAVEVLLAIAEDEGAGDEIRFGAASTLLHAPVYDLNEDVVEDLAERIAERVKAEVS